MWASAGSRIMRAIGLPLGLLLLLAGCVTPASTEDGSLSAASVAVLDDALAALEAGEPAANLRLLGEYRNSGGAEAAAFGDLVYVMRAGAVVVLNVSDPADLQEVAVIDPEHRVLDVKLSHDGKYLFIGDDDEGAIPALVEATGTQDTFKGGIYVYDVTDPENAELVTFLPIGPRRGPHMVFYHLTPDGRELVLGANADISISEFDREAGTLTLLSTYSPDLVTGYNREPYVVDALYQGWAHDMFVMTEPDGSVYMYVANWDAGLRIVDITDPARPEELGHWMEFPEGHSGNLHTVSAQWIGDKRIVVGAVEVGFAVVGGIGYAQGAEPSVLYVWDATDPAAIELLGTWENPEGIKAGGRPAPVFDEPVSSTHNLQFENGTIYLAHYALGVFVLDASTPETWAQPKIQAYYREEGIDTWDIIVHRGTIFTSGSEGILSLQFPLAPADLTSRA